MPSTSPQVPTGLLMDAVYDSAGIPTKTDPWEASASWAYPAHGMLTPAEEHDTAFFIQPMIGQEFYDVLFSPATEPVGDLGLDLHVPALQSHSEEDVVAAQSIYHYRITPPPSPATIPRSRYPQVRPSPSPQVIFPQVIPSPFHDCGLPQQIDPSLGYFLLPPFPTTVPLTGFPSTKIPPSEPQSLYHSRITPPPSPVQFEASFPQLIPYSYYDDLVFADPEPTIAPSAAFAPQSACTQGRERPCPALSLSTHLGSRSRRGVPVAELPDAVLQVKLEAAGLTADEDLEEVVKIQPVRSSAPRGNAAMLTADGIPLPKPFRCELCIASFSRKHDLKRHTRVHLGIRPFGCPNSACDKVFSRSDALNRHMAKWGCDRHADALKDYEQDQETSCRRAKSS
ncbi:hypothetical protein HKX48_006989 [Thoreauomyces humboldtii]|nr:hypothetical protein HKX48_006989 [Thoreauomyces humboldtii]